MILSESPRAPTLRGIVVLARSVATLRPLRSHPRVENANRRPGTKAGNCNDASQNSSLLVAIGVFAVTPNPFGQVNSRRGLTLFSMRPPQFGGHCEPLSK